MFKLTQKDKFLVKVKGLLSFPIQYEVRVTDGNWEPFFGKYENQKWGMWDSNSCWCLSAINSAEDQLEWLHKNGLLSDESKKFFMDNGYIDSDGDYSLSEIYLEILGGNESAGGTSNEAWQLMQEWGCIPRLMLTYSINEANAHMSREAFNADYFNKSKVTPHMIALGKEFKTHISVSYQKIGKTWITPNKEILKSDLKQAPIMLGIPIPKSTWLWNTYFVQWDGSKTLQHEVELYKIDAEGNYLVFDQYEPHLKILSKDYYLPVVTQGILYPMKKIANPIPQPSDYWISFWTAVNNFFNNIPNPFQVGKKHA